jgi:hypothetical protein
MAGLATAATLDEELEEDDMERCGVDPDLKWGVDPVGMELVLVWGAIGETDLRFKATFLLIETGLSES